jgi:hypothetical protein
MFNNAGIRVLFVRLWRQFYVEVMLDDFEDQLQDYLNGTGTFTHIQSQCTFELQGAETKVIDPLIYPCN